MNKQVYLALEKENMLENINTGGSGTSGGSNSTGTNTGGSGT